MPITLEDLRRFAVHRSLFKPTTLRGAIHKLGFVQADPIRAPARAQDLILRHRANNYLAGDLERHYPKLGIEEDYFVPYGFVTSAIHKLMHPRPDLSVPANGAQPWPAERRERAQLLLDFVEMRGSVHPREVDEHFSHGSVTNYWGGSSNATTQLLDAMHYRGLLRIARREGGIRIYSAHRHEPCPDDSAEYRVRIDTLVDVVVRIYAPLSDAGLSFFLRPLRYAIPQWKGEITGAIQRAKKRLAHTEIVGTVWYWPADEKPMSHAPQEAVRLLAPFDPVVRDRDRFELLWGWQYRFEAYVPAPKRKLGYYALPLLWRDCVIGWGNLSVKNGELRSEIGYVEARPPADPDFKHELDAELDRMRTFLGLDSGASGLDATCPM